MQQSFRWWRYLTLVLLLISSGHMYAIDEAIMYGTTVQLWQLFSGTLPSSQPIVSIFSKYGPVQSIMALPWYALGKVLSLAVDVEFREFIVQWVVTWQSVVVVSTTAVLLRWMVLRAGYSYQVARLLALVYAFASMATVYSRTFFSDATVALWLLLGAVPLFVQYPQSKRLRWLMVIAGLSLFFAVFTKIAVAPAVLIWGIAIFLSIWLDRDWDKALYWGVGVLVGVGCYVSFNMTLYGHVLGSIVVKGYGGNSLSSDPWIIAKGLQGLYLSWDKGLFLYTPFAVLWPLGLFWKRLPPRIFWASLLVISVVSLIHAALLAQNLPMWPGGGSWGPRYLLIVLPLILLGTAPVWQELYRRQWRHVRLLTVMLSGLTMVVVGSAMILSINTYVLTRRTLPNYDAPWYNAVIGHWVILANQIDADVRAQIPPAVTLTGWSHSEGNLDAGEAFPRWMGSQASVHVQSVTRDYPVLRMQAWQCVGEIPLQRTFKIQIDDTVVGDVAGCPSRHVLLLLPRGKSSLALSTEAAPPIPADAYQARWISEYGVLVQSLDVVAGEKSLPIRTRPFAEEHLPQHDFRHWLGDARRGMYDFWWYYLWKLPAPHITTWPVAVIVMLIWSTLVEWSLFVRWIRQRWQRV